MKNIKKSKSKRKRKRKSRKIDGTKSKKIGRFTVKTSPLNIKQKLNNLSDNYNSVELHVNIKELEEYKNLLKKYNEDNLNKLI